MKLNGFPPFQAPLAAARVAWSTSAGRVASVGHSILAAGPLARLQSVLRGERFESRVIQEIYGDPRETEVALQGLYRGWGIREMEEALGSDKMVLLLREHRKDIRGTILAHRWRKEGFVDFGGLVESAKKDYVALRGHLSLPELVGAGRGAPIVFFTTKTGKNIYLPFVTFREFSEPSTPLFYYSYIYGNLVIVKWPRALTFNPEPLLHPDFTRIDERWVLGGIPARFVVYRGIATDVERELRRMMGDKERFFNSLRSSRKPVWV